MSSQSFFFYKSKSPLYWTDTLVIWYHRSMASDDGRDRWSKWFGFAFGSGLAVLKKGADALYISKKLC